MSQETPNGQPTTANEVIAALRSGRLTQPRGAASLTATRQQHLRKADTEAWIMVYLDVITLLLVFFVLMLASVNVDLLGGKTELQQPLELTTGETNRSPPSPNPSNKPAVK